MSVAVTQEDKLIAAQAKEIAALKQRIEAMSQRLSSALKEDRVIRRAREWRNADDRRKECRNRYYQFIESLEEIKYNLDQEEPKAYRQAAAAAGVARRKLYEAIDEMDREATT